MPAKVVGRVFPERMVRQALWVVRAVALGWLGVGRGSSIRGVLTEKWLFAVDTKHLQGLAFPFYRLGGQLLEV